MVNAVIKRVLLTETACAEQLGLSVKTLRRWRWLGKGPHFVKLGGAVRYVQGDIDTFVDSSRCASTSTHSARDVGI